MTFSNPKVKMLLTKRFVCAWVNTEGDPNAGASFAHEPGTPAGTCIRGNGEHNIQLLMLTPKGKILNVVAGYIAPKELVEELELALRIDTSLREPGERDVPADTVKRAQREFLESIEDKTFRGSGGLSIMQGTQRRRVAQDHRWVVRNPLLDADDFRPASLVGNGRSFFSSSSGQPSGEGIGDEDALKLRERIREGLFPPDNDDDEGEGKRGNR